MLGYDPGIGQVIPFEKNTHFTGMVGSHWASATLQIHVNLNVDQLTLTCVTEHEIGIMKERRVKPT